MEQQEFKSIFTNYFSRTENKEEPTTQAVTAVDVVLFGLNTIIPLMTEDLLRVGNSRISFGIIFNHFSYCEKGCSEQPE